MKYRLISIQKTPVTLYMFPKTVGNRVSYSHYMRLFPNEIYETSDDAQIEFLKTHKDKVKYSEALEYALKESGVPYNVIVCKTCGGRVKKIEYSNIEVLENE